MKLLASRLLLPLTFVPLGCLAVASLAAAQLNFTQLNFLGRSTPSVTLNGVEFARADAVSHQLKVTRSGDVVKVEGIGSVLLLPIDKDQRRATTNFNTVQMGTERMRARTATLINGNVYLPLETLATALGAEYTPGTFKLPSPELTGVASRAGEKADRVVLDVNRDVRYELRRAGSELQLILPGTTGAEQTYSTRGQFLPRVKVTRKGNDLVVSAALKVNDGYRAYRTQRGTGLRIVLDVGPGVSREAPALNTRLHKPLIVLDAAVSAQGGRLSDVALEVARETGELLTKAGWQVRLTRLGRSSANLAERAELARESDVFISLDVGQFPGAAASGLTVYQSGGESGLAVIDNLRGTGDRDVLAALTVGDTSVTRRLTQLLQGELKAVNVPVRTSTIDRLYLLREAPHAALLVELGWVQNQSDVNRLSAENRRRDLATALARSIATLLTSRANGGPQ